MKIGIQANDGHSFWILKNIIQFCYFKKANKMHNWVGGRQGKMATSTE